MTRDGHDANETTKPNDLELARLRATLPEYFDKDGNFKVNRLQDALSSADVSMTREGYELKFLGKAYAKYLASTRTETVVVPDLEHNTEAVNAESENLYIVGDNLDALKHLLGSYAGKVKCIYIDPPYNTGKDGFVYNDDFGFSAVDLVNKIGLDEDEARRVMDLHGKSSHSAWLTFMYPRLAIAKELLLNQGIIFISVDDNEQANARLLCDEVFGEGNWLGTLVWKNATDNNPSQIAVEHEYVLVYAKSKDMAAPIWKSSVSATKDLLVSVGAELAAAYPDQAALQEAYTEWFRENKWQLGQLDRYKYIDADGIFTGSQSVHNPGKEGYRYDVIHPVTKKACKQPLFGYRFTEETMQAMIDEGRILFGEDESKIVEIKVYARDFTDKLRSVIALDGRAGATEIADLLGDKVFTNPKPSQLLMQIFDFVLDPGDTVLDFFSGSATTADAVMQLNARDGGDRRFILVQLPERIGAGKPGAKQGYSTIDEVGRARIKRVAQRIQSSVSVEIDGGFRLFRLEQPSQKTLDQLQSFDPNEDGALLAGDFVSKFAAHGTSGAQVALATWLIQDGFGLTPVVQNVVLDDYELKVCKDSGYIIEPGLNSDGVMTLVAKLEAGDLDLKRLVVFGYSVPFSVLHELRQNLKSLRSGQSVSVIERY